MSYAKDSKIKRIIKGALAEDIGSGDVTTKLLFPGNKKIRAEILTKRGGIICGVDIARMVFKALDKNTRFSARVKEGERIRAGQVVAEVCGSVSGILCAERVALNFLGMLSAIATRTSLFVKKIKNSQVRIMDTRKTIPGLRQLQKYAVKIGGGYNHRFRLDEMVLIKDNHLIALCSIPRLEHYREVVEKIKRKKPKDTKLEIEVKNLREFRQALKARPDIIMLDNMKASDVKKAVIIMHKDCVKLSKAYKPLLEVSGSINFENITEFAQTGIDIISLGTLTKDIHCLDLSLEVK